MNNYNDYYNYMNGYSDMNYMTNPNSMIGDFNYQNAFTNTFMPTGSGSNDILEPYEGFKRGNMFANLYDPYRNYKPMELSAGSEKEDMLMQIRELKFAMVDLDLYLDTHPNDTKALSLFNNYAKQEKELCKMYESKYGPLTIGGEGMNKGWTWVNGPWPWEEQK